MRSFLIRKVDSPFLSNCKIVTPATYVDEDDLIFGKYKNVKITIVEANVVDKGGRCAYRYEKDGKIMFLGLLIFFPSNKKSTRLLSLL